MDKIYSKERDTYIPTIILLIRFDDFISKAVLDPPILGRDTIPVLKWLGYNNDDIKRFKAKGIMTYHNKF